MWLGPDYYELMVPHWTRFLGLKFCTFALPFLSSWLFCARTSVLLVSFHAPGFLSRSQFPFALVSLYRLIQSPPHTSNLPHTHTHPSHTNSCTAPAHPSPTPTPRTLPSHTQPTTPPPPTPITHTSLGFPVWRTAKTRRSANSHFFFRPQRFRFSSLLALFFLASRSRARNREKSAGAHIW